MLRAIEWLETREGVNAEPAGAAATAAAIAEFGMTADTDVTSGGPSVLLVTGGNIAPETTALVDALRRRGPAPPP
jgi:threonine synthase